jgi:hypothetical protein
MTNYFSKIDNDSLNCSLIFIARQFRFPKHQRSSSTVQKIVDDLTLLVKLQQQDEKITEKLYNKFKIYLYIDEIGITGKKSQRLSPWANDFKKQLETIFLPPPSVEKESEKKVGETVEENKEQEKEQEQELEQEFSNNENYQEENHQQESQQEEKEEENRDGWETI